MDTCPVLKRFYCVVMNVLTQKSYEATKSIYLGLRDRSPGDTKSTEMQACSEPRVGSAGLNRQKPQGPTCFGSIVFGTNSVKLTI